MNTNYASQTRPDALASMAGLAEEPDHWVARELHDVVAQCLTTVVVELEMMRRDRLPLRSRLRVEALDVEVRTALHGVRELLHRLRREPVAEHRLVESLGGMLDEFHARTAIETQLEVSPEWPEEVPVDCALNLRRLVQEALTNVRMHSDARRVRVSLEILPHGPSVTITDDGAGKWEPLDERTAGMGILGMRERAAILGGTLEIESASFGTTVRVTLDRGAMAECGLR